MRRSWLIAYAVALVPGLMLLVLATAMGWDYEVVGLPVVGCIILGVFVLDRLEQRDQRRPRGGAPATRR